MLDTVKSAFWKFHDSFHRSETILFARLQVLFGVVFEVLTHTDLSPLIHDQRVLTYWLIGSGVATELLRRRGQDVDDDNHLVPRQ